VDKRVVWDPRVNLLTSQGPGTAIDFGLKIIDLLVGRESVRSGVIAGDAGGDL
jgi:4-methyl-5(b-hydroxyethyl)-thiazole monophosphate biosynthesis